MLASNISDRGRATRTTRVALIAAVMAVAVPALAVEIEAAEEPALTGSVGVAGAVALDSPSADPGDTMLQMHSSPGAQFHIGDRLRINFFEHLELPQPAGADMTTAMRTFYQRLDLSGEYRVDVDGTIAIPLLGQFHVDGSSLDELRSEIAIAFERETGRGGDVHVAIVERQPVFVMGVVRNPGSYAFSPGMIVLQAVALAGGFERLPEGATQHLEARRERERLAQATQRHRRLIAQRARLLEERDGKPASGPHPVLAQARPEVAILIDGERSLREVEAAARQSEVDSQAAALESARGELAALRESVGLVEQQIEARSERLRVLQQMQGRGVANLEIVWTARKDVTDFELQREQLLSAIHVAEQKVVQAELAMSRIELDHRARVARDLVAVADEIAQLETTIATAGDMARALEALAASRGIGPQDSVRIEILRRTAHGVATLDAGESTDLMPGDVVKVVVERADSAPAAQAMLR